VLLVQEDVRFGLENPKNLRIWDPDMGHIMGVLPKLLWESSGSCPKRFFVIPE
jgi:hypothetical protein